MDFTDIEKLYVDDMLSTTDIAKLKNCSVTKIRYRLNKLGVLRSRNDGIRNAKHKLGKHLLGKTYKMKQSTKDKIRKKRIEYSEKKITWF